MAHTLRELIGDIDAGAGTTTLLDQALDMPVHILAADGELSILSFCTAYGELYIDVQKDRS